MCNCPSKLQSIVVHYSLCVIGHFAWRNSTKGQQLLSLRMTYFRLSEWQKVRKNSGQVSMRDSTVSDFSERLYSPLWIKWLPNSMHLESTHLNKFKSAVHRKEKVLHFPIYMHPSHLCNMVLSLFPSMNLLVKGRKEMTQDRQAQIHRFVKGLENCRPFKILTFAFLKKIKHYICY